MNPILCHIFVDLQSIIEEEKEDSWLEGNYFYSLDDRIESKNIDDLVNGLVMDYLKSLFHDGNSNQIDGVDLDQLYFSITNNLASDFMITQNLDPCEDKDVFQGITIIDDLIVQDK